MKRRSEDDDGPMVESERVGPAGVYLVCGLQGTGKSTVARMIAEATGAAHFRTDVIRRQMFEEPTYSEVEMQAVYDEMMRRVAGVTGEGKSVVLDATFKLRANRDWVREMVRESGLEVMVVLVDIADDEVVQKRLDAREGDASDAGFEHYLATKAKFENGDIDVVIDNSGTIEDLTVTIAELFE